MAVLQRREDRRLFEWQIDTLVGRSTFVDDITADDSAGVSTHHAALTWSARLRCWQVRDLGGGTAVDGIRLAPGSARSLTSGSLLRLGDMEWEVIDVAAPPVHARCAADGAVVLGLDGVLALPSDAAPERMALYTRGGWVMRPASLTADEAAADPVDEGATWVAGERRWQIRLPPTISERSRWLVRLADARLDLVRGEAGFDATLRAGGRWQALPARAHHGLLWALARARIADAGRAAEEQGWRAAATVVGAGGAARVAVMVQRAVRQLGAQGVIDAERLFEVRGESLRLAAGLDVRLLGRDAPGDAAALPDGG